jgi:hypothetical protein
VVEVVLALVVVTLVVVVEEAWVLARMVVVEETVMVVVVRPSDSTARNARGFCPFAAMLPVTVRQSGAMDAFRRTACRLPHTGQRLLIRVPFGVTLISPRRSGHSSIPTPRP